jgi:3-methyladenine DNA glycosylase AlkD
VTRASDAYLAALDDRFSRARDRERAPAMAAYMRDQFPFLGLPKPVRTPLERDVYATAGGASLSERDLADLALTCWARDEREYQYAACDVLDRRVKVLGPGFLPTAEQLITTKSWWDTVDALAGHVVGSIVRADLSQRALMDRWLVDPDIWLARTAILHQLSWKGDTDPGWLFDACLTRAGDTEFFIRKAIGWALRSYSYVDAAAVEAFVTAHADELAGLSRREAMKAIERARSRTRSTRG